MLRALSALCATFVLLVQACGGGDKAAESVANASAAEPAPSAKGPAPVTWTDGGSAGRGGDAGDAG